MLFVGCFMSVFIHYDEQREAEVNEPKEQQVPGEIWANAQVDNSRNSKQE